MEHSGMSKYGPKALKKRNKKENSLIQKNPNLSDNAISENSEVIFMVNWSLYFANIGREKEYQY